MDNNYVLRAERAFDTLCSWLFNTRPFSTPPYMTSFLHSGKIDTHYYGDNDHSGNYSRTLLSTFSEILHYPGHLWRQWGPDAYTLDNLLWNYTPDIHALQKRLGLEILSETYNVDPRIILSILVLPLLLLLLMTWAHYLGRKTASAMMKSKVEGDAESKTSKKVNVKGSAFSPKKKGENDAMASPSRQSAAKPDAALKSKAAKAKGSVAHSLESLRRHTPHPNRNSKESDGPEISPSPTEQGEGHESTTVVGRDLGSRILGYAQSSSFLRNVDMLSGGILGIAITTVAVLATTAETTASLIKESLPGTVADFTEELKDSFDHALKAELPEYATESDDETWVAHQGASQTPQEDRQATVSSKSVTASTQTTCGQPGPHATYAEVAATGIAMAKKRPKERELFGDNVSVGPNLAKANAEDDSAAVSAAEVNPPLGSCSTDATHGARDLHLKGDDGAEADDDEPQAKRTHDDDYKDDSEDEDHECDEEDTGDDDNVDDGSVHEHHLGHLHHHGRRQQTPDAKNESPVQNYTVDGQGNKVDVRRDSGFDMPC